jgi:hypothetical protein
MNALGEIWRTGTPATRRPATRRPTTPRPTTQRPTTQRPATPRPATRKGGESRRGESPRGESPRSESQRSESPRSKSPRSKSPRGKRPRSENLRAFSKHGDPKQMREPKSGSHNSPPICCWDLGKFPVGLYSLTNYESERYIFTFTDHRTLQGAPVVRYTLQGVPFKSTSEYPKLRRV